MGKKVVLFILTAGTVLTLGIISYVFQFTTTTSANIFKEVDRNAHFEGRLKEISLKEGEPISVLVMGVDTRVGEQGGQTDTLVLLTVNPESESIKMVSIPRDTYVNIEGGLNKINSAYGIGNVGMTMDTVETLLDVPVDYYVEVDMKSFTGIIDTLGGVKVNNKFEWNTNKEKFTNQKVHFPEGKLTLDGNDALLYARMRKADPRGDLGRQERQRQVIESILKQTSEVSTITKVEELAKVVGKNINTNLGIFNFWHLQSNYLNASQNIKQYEISGEDNKIDGTYYYMPDKENLHKLSIHLKKHLEIIDENQYADVAEPDQSKGAHSEEDSSKSMEEEQNNDSPKEKSKPQKETEKADKEDKDSVNPDENSRENTAEEPEEPIEKKTQDEDINEDASHESEGNAADDSTENHKEAQESNESGENNESDGGPNVAKVITKDWEPVPTKQEKYSGVTFEKGTQDWKEMTEAISKGAGLAESDMILWWVSGNGVNSVEATVTNKAQTENFRVYVSWVEGTGYKPAKVEILHENDKK
ncbi:DUF1510 family protein [Halobacillus massiliensis]|uniref:DUF1510 family protein n=1 Tax=Halobacillus massiliensis TaxID=1926286 RepID=UPI0009E3EBDB|nr:DUF1510 family protein [Halobacillus massiliensis]